MKIDYSKTLHAWHSYEGKPEFLTAAVHEHVLSNKYLGKPGIVKPLWKAIHKIADRNDQVTLPAFIGKLEKAMPGLSLGIKLSPADRIRSRKTAAGLIMNVLLDHGYYREKSELKTLRIGNERKYRTVVYIVLGGDSDRNLYRGLHLEPGVVHQRKVLHWSLTEEQKEMLSYVSSVGYKVWEGCSKELLMHGYSLKEDWSRTHTKDGKTKLKESVLKRRWRFEGYAKKIIDDMKRYPCVYFSAKYDHRYRIYYDFARLEGVRPQGRLWETLMLDLAEPYHMGVEDEKVLKHIIYCTLHGRASMDKALEKISDKDYARIMDINPLKTKGEKEFGEALLLIKAFQALCAYWEGKPTTFMFGYDFTNSGLMMSAASFRSKEMMKAANLGGHKTVYDSHTQFGKKFGLDLDRDVVKSMQQGLLHGSTHKGLAETLRRTLEDETISDEAVTAGVEAVYGPCVHNIERIGDWCGMAVGNRQSLLRFHAPDGWRAGSQAYMEGVPLRVYCASARHAKHYVAYTCVTDMPLIEDANGYPVYDKKTELDGVPYPVTVHKRGLYADITHANDAFVLRHIVKALVAAGRPFMLKHDDFIVPPGAVPIVKQAAKEALQVLYRDNTYQRAMENIAQYSPYKLELPPLVMGDALDTIEASDNFLMP